MGALQYRNDLRSSVLLSMTNLTAASVVLSGEARLETAIVAAMKLRIEVVRILDTRAGLA
jgi:hypothetical protein